MIIHNLVQGSPEWLAYRKTMFNASDAPAMMGESHHKTRTELLDRIKFGIEREVSEREQKLFDDGHRCEALCRPLAEKIVGEDLYPVVGSLGKLSASFDGLTMMEDVAFEHKALNDELREAIKDTECGHLLPLHYRAQLEQQCMVSGAKRILFMASKWTDDGQLIDARHTWYYPDPALANQITKGWLQFEKDLESHVLTQKEVKPSGRAPETLPTLHIQVSGSVTASNLPEYKAHALAVFQSINRDLKTDEDFANAEKTVKWCADVEDRLSSAKQFALSQTASIEDLFRAIDDISAEARRVRLELDKLVKARKESIRNEIVFGAATALRNHVDTLNTRLGTPLMPFVACDFGLVIKGKKSLTSMRDAVDTELARAKIAANDTADLIQINLQTLRSRQDLSFLFPDVKQLVLKASDDLAATMTARIVEHEAKEAARKESEARAAEALKRAAEAAPEPVVAPAPVAVAPIAPPAQAPQQAAPAQTNEVPTLKLGTVCERLGFHVTAEFLTSLGITAHVDRSAKLYRESDFPRICARLIQHIQRCQQATAENATAEAA